MFYFAVYTQIERIRPRIQQGRPFSEFLQSDTKLRNLRLIPIQPSFKVSTNQAAGFCEANMICR